MSRAPHQAVSAALAETAGKIAIAVSGGGDSLALLDLAQGLAAGRILGVTLDHRLRPEAGAEAAMVAAYCLARGIPHQTLCWQGWDGQGNLQAEARAARYRLIAAWGRSLGIAEVWLGHSRDDVAETLLIRLGRAAGLDGLSRMAAVFERDGMTWRRPLLGIARDPLRAHLRAKGLAWVEDPSNADPHYARVRAREALRHLAPLGITPEALAHSAEALASARAMIEETLRAEWAARLRIEGGDLLLRLEGAGEELSRRLTLAALRWMGGGAWPVRQSGLEDLRARLAMARHHTLGGCLVSRIPEGLRFAREWQAVRDLVVPFGQDWDGRWQISGPVQAGSGHEIRALGEGIGFCPGWRETGIPRRSLMAGPAVWHQDRLIAAPLARKDPEWCVKLRPSFATGPFAH